MSRPIFHATDAPGQVKVISHTIADERYKTCIVLQGLVQGNCAACVKQDELQQNTYLTVYENKIEYNYPCATCCCFVCCVYDRHAVIYLDRDLVKRADKADCCYPAATHMHFCPTCFDACGEAVVLYGATSCTKEGVVVPHEAAFCPCRAFVVLQGWPNAKAISDTIVKQQQIATSRASAPGTVSMGER